MSDTDDCHGAAPLDGSDATAARRRVAVLGFAALWRGERPAVASLTDDLADVHALVRAGRLEVDATGVVVGVHGLVARTTRHRIEHAGGVAHTWCALDAIGIPSALRIDADAVTSCPTCGAELRVVLLDGQPVDRGQPLRLWLPEGPCDHLVEDFCNHANLYCSPDHLTATMPDDSPGRAVTISEAATIGRQTWHDAATTLASREDESR